MSGGGGGFDKLMVQTVMQRFGHPVFKAGDLVITKLKNRWGLDCAGTVEATNGDLADVRVWNLNGPGADMLVTGIPFRELEPSK